MELENKILNTKNIIFLGIINSIEEYYSISKSVEEINVFEELEEYNRKIITITEEEIKNFFGTYKDISELRNKSYEYYKEHIQGTNIDIGNFKDIRIPRKSAERYKHYGSDERKLLIVPKLLDILKTSKYKNSEGLYKKRSDNIVKFHYFINEVLLKENFYKIYITIGEDNKGNLFYDLDENKEKPQGVDSITSEVSLRHKQYNIKTIRCQ